MAQYKVVYFFEGVQATDYGASSAVGWTETWYYNSDLGINDLIRNPIIDDYATQRRKILHRIYRIAFVRVSVADQDHIFKIRTLVNQVGDLYTGVFTFEPAQVQCGILTDMMFAQADGGKTHHKRFIIRGLTSDIINGNVIKRTSSTWAKVLAFLDYVAHHESGKAQTATSFSGFGIRYRPSPYANEVVQSITPLTSDRRYVTVVPNLDAAAPGDTVRIRRVSTPRGCNRAWRVISQNPGANSMVLGRSRLPIESTYTGEGEAYMFAETFLVAGLQQYTVIGLRSHKTGKLFHQLRGRSSSTKD